MPRAGMRGRVAAAVHGAEAEQDGRGDNGNRAQHAPCRCRRGSRPASSRKSTRPHSRPKRELAFHSGKAMASPTSRMAKTVSVLATAHSAPASSAHTIRCFFSPQVADDVAGALEQGGEGPARGEDAGHHPQRDGEGREADVDQLGRRLGRAQPHAGGESAGYAEAMEGMGVLGGNGRVRVAWFCLQVRADDRGLRMGRQGTASGSRGGLYHLPPIPWPGMTWSVKASAAITAT